MAKTNNDLSDIQNPDLTERLARYVGALQLHRDGNVSDEFLSKKLEDLQVACRAADRLLAVMAEPGALAAVADRMHAKLTETK